MWTEPVELKQQVSYPQLIVWTWFCRRVDLSSRAKPHTVPNKAKQKILLVISNSVSIITLFKMRLYIKECRRITACFVTSKTF